MTFDEHVQRSLAARTAQRKEKAVAMDNLATDEAEANSALKVAGMRAVSFLQKCEVQPNTIVAPKTKKRIIPRREPSDRVGWRLGVLTLLTDGAMVHEIFESGMSLDGRISKELRQQRERRREQQRRSRARSFLVEHVVDRAAMIRPRVYSGAYQPMVDPPKYEFAYNRDTQQISVIIHGYRSISPDQHLAELMLDMGYIKNG